jgi:3-oxoacyl-[acyl-carrier-protein] synthase-1
MCTPVGLDARTSGFMLRAGMPAMSSAPIADSADESVAMAWIPTIDPKLTGYERLSALARIPLEEALFKTGIAGSPVDHPIAGLRIQVRLAIDEDVPEAPLAARVLEGMIGRLAPGATISVEAKGESAFGKWLPEAIAAVDARQYEAVVLGGVHSDYDPRSIRALEENDRLFSRDNLDGRIPGEAAAFVVVMRDADAKRHGLKPLARLIGAGVGQERARPDNDLPAYEALGMTTAVKKAAETLAETGQTAGWMLTDLTPEMRRLREWEAVFVRTSHVLGMPYAVESPAQRIGYLGAATLPLFTSMVATAYRYGYAPSPLALLMTGNDRGDRAALTLGKA